MGSYLQKLREKVSANPVASLLVSAGVTYVTTKYGPAISVAQEYLCR